MSNKKILIVDDDADVRLGYQILLGARDYQTIFAADALTALSEAQKHQPDLLILDLGLPVGNGFFALERFRKYPSLASIPVLVVTARELHGNKDRALQAGARAYLQKPWNDNELLATIRRLLDEPGVSVSHP
jgi:two-component system KDP operon response regulator KdpE